MRHRKATRENLRQYLKERVYLFETHWLWTKSLVSGYGQFGFEGKLQLAHRMSYIAFIGPIPVDKPCILHIQGLCHIRKCINPNHLYPGTNMENIQDKIQEGTHAQISPTIVSLIKQRVASGERQIDVSKSLLVSKTHVSNIVNCLKRKEV